MHGRATALLLLMLVAGCDEVRTPTYFGEEPAPAPPAELAAAFDPLTSGRIAGRVTWDGDVPRVAPFRAPISPLSEQPAGPKQLWPNPHAPVIDVMNRGVAGAIVFLRGVDPERSRPWFHPPVRVTVRQCRYHVLQGDSDTITGFVRRGDKITIISEDDRFQAVQARGAAFFTLTLPDRDRPHERVLAHSGVVELTSNAGQFWMRGHLFVADHPYLARTDATGRFVLDKVPAGTYELGCWLPNWNEAAHELDAETGHITHLTFHPSVVKLRDITVEPGSRQGADFRFATTDFAR